ncbi:MAG: helix-turn-helix domain-containing protein [Lachnospira sp.]|nr:helix-turn-helix domain-containing protein [Lachnospira sp.]
MKKKYKKHKKYKKLTYNDRKIIEQMTAEKKNPREIAVVTDVCIQTMYRELKKGRNEDGIYKAEIAQKALFS